MLDGLVNTNGGSTALTAYIASAMRRSGVSVQVRTYYVLRGDCGNNMYLGPISYVRTMSSEQNEFHIHVFLGWKIGENL